MIDTKPTSATILIVEDSPTQAARLQYVLEQNGYGTFMAANGSHALAQVREQVPSLIVSDVVMPEMDGYQFCRQIKADPALKAVPVILLTSLADPVDVVRGLECGADNFITKPYEEKYLLSRIQYILINRELNKSDKMQMGIEIFFAGEKYFITSERQQILNLLLSTYEAAVQKNLELIRTQDALRHLNEHLEEEVAQRTVALRENLAKLGALVENLQMGVLFESDNGKILNINQTFSDMFQLSSPARWVGANSAELNHEIKKPFSNPEWFVQRLGDCIRQNQVAMADPIQTSAGRTLERDYVPIRVGSESGGHLWLYRDVTERRRAADALRQSEEQLRQSQKMEAIGRLAGGVAHDFNNLLTIIISYSDFLLNDLSEDQESYKEVAEIRKAGERAADLTRQLLAFSRKQVLQPKVLDLNSVIVNIEKMLQRIIGEDIELMTRLASDLGKVEADPGQIEQVIMNLAVNARDAMPEGGQLTIETAHAELGEDSISPMGVAPGSYVVLTVTDTGTGMTPETQARIFEPFFTTKDEGKGTGLGLSMIYGIVEQSGGTIRVYSEIDKGTTFKVYLPRIRSGEMQQATTSPRHGVSMGSETILVVEDDDSVRQLSTAVLRAQGYDIREARSGFEALSILQEHAGAIDLIITDVVMPQMSGRELATRVRELHGDLKVLYVSGYTDDSVVRHGVLNSGTLFLQKPFTPQILAHKVREVLDQPNGTT